MTWLVSMEHTNTHVYNIEEVIRAVSIEEVRHRLWYKEQLLHLITLCHQLVSRKVLTQTIICLDILYVCIVGLTAHEAEVLLLWLLLDHQWQLSLLVLLLWLGHLGVRFLHLFLLSCTFWNSCLYLLKRSRDFIIDILIEILDLPDEGNEEATGVLIMGQHS